jgi:exosortase C (VPDSG-CTERM-specific)
VLNEKLIDSSRDRRNTDERLAPVSEESEFARRRRMRGLVTGTAILIVCFFRPLYDLARYSLTSELYSYIPLVPLISLYLGWLRRRSLFLDSEPVWQWAVLPLVGGVGILAGYAWATHAGWQLGAEDYLALMTLSFLLFLWSACFLFVGRESLRAIAFPAVFLIFTIPFPAFLRDSIEYFLQHSSAEAAFVLFQLSGTPTFHQDLVFELPGFALRVAPECSGIHSTLVLFITSLLAGYLFLRTAWTRALLTFCVIPLAILRNGLRIFVIGQLCVHVSPEMINSDIHRHGGPIFFVLSLVPFFWMLLLLRKSESKSGRTLEAKDEN